MCIEHFLVNAKHYSINTCVCKFAKKKNLNCSRFHCQISPVRAREYTSITDITASIQLSALCKEKRAHIIADLSIIYRWSTLTLVAQ